MSQAMAAKAAPQKSGPDPQIEQAKIASAEKIEQAKLHLEQMKEQNALQIAVLKIKAEMQMRAMQMLADKQQAAEQAVVDGHLDRANAVLDAHVAHHGNVMANATDGNREDATARTHEDHFRPVGRDDSGAGTKYAPMSKACIVNFGSRKCVAEDLDPELLRRGQCGRCRRHAEKKWA
jgi:hypothetical protein